MSSQKPLLSFRLHFLQMKRKHTWVPSIQLMVKALKKTHPEIKIIVLSIFYPTNESTYQWHDVEVISFAGMHKKQLRRFLLWRGYGKR